MLDRHGLLDRIRGWIEFKKDPRKSELVFIYGELFNNVLTLEQAIEKLSEKEAYENAPKSQNE